MYMYVYVCARITKLSQNSKKLKPPPFDIRYLHTRSTSKQTFLMKLQNGFEFLLVVVIVVVAVVVVVVVLTFNRVAQPGRARVRICAHLPRTERVRAQWPSLPPLAEQSVGWGQSEATSASTPPLLRRANLAR